MKRYYPNEDFVTFDMVHVRTRRGKRDNRRMYRRAKKRDERLAMKEAMQDLVDIKQELQDAMAELADDLWYEEDYDYYREKDTGRRKRSTMSGQQTSMYERSSIRTLLMKTPMSMSGSITCHQETVSKRRSRLTGEWRKKTSVSHSGRSWKKF